MKLKDAKVGDDVVLFVAPMGKHLVVPSLTPSAVIFKPGRVIATYKSLVGKDLFLVAWTASNNVGSMDVPNAFMASPSSTDIKNHPALASYNTYAWYSYDYEVFKINGSANINGNVSIATATTEEKPCITCKRNNFLNEKTCWCCGNHPFLLVKR